MLYTLIVVYTMTGDHSILARNMSIYRCAGEAAQAGIIYDDPGLPEELRTVRLFCMPETGIKRGY